MGHWRRTQLSQLIIIFMLALGTPARPASELPVSKCCIPPVSGRSIAFKPLSQSELRLALGPTQKLPATLQKAFMLSEVFQPLTCPQCGDWLAVHPEPGQTFEDFVHGDWHQPGPRRGKIYLQPVGAFVRGQSPPLERLRELAAAYFALEVELLPVLEVDKQSFTTRINSLTGNRQLLVDDFLALLQNRLPADAFCMLGITNEDLYPEPDWNFVFGMATLRERIGVISLARYDPALYGEPRGQDFHKLLLKRTAKVMIHEIGHMCGLLHCIYFKCIMNGSNHLPEGDQRPPHLCPICLRKLHRAIGFDIRSRYHKLFQIYQQCGFEAEAQWIERRLQSLEADN